MFWNSVSNKMAILACFGLQTLEMDFKQFQMSLWMILNFERCKTLVSPDIAFFKKNHIRC